MAQWPNGPKRIQKVWIKIHKSFWNTAVPYPPPLGAPLGPFDFEIHVSVPLRHPESTGVATLSSSLPSLRRVVNKGWGLHFKNFHMCCLLTFARRHASFIFQQNDCQCWAAALWFRGARPGRLCSSCHWEKFWCLKNLQEVGRIVGVMLDMYPAKT